MNFIHSQYNNSFMTFSLRSIKWPLYLYTCFTWVSNFQLHIKFVQWTLVMTNSLGPVKLLCYIEILLYPNCKNNKIQRYFELWDQENYFVISGFCNISVLYNERPLYLKYHEWQHYFRTFELAFLGLAPAVSASA